MLYHLQSETINNSKSQKTCQFLCKAAAFLFPFLFKEEKWEAEEGIIIHNC